MKRKKVIHRISPWETPVRLGMALAILGVVFLVVIGVMGANNHLRFAPDTVRSNYHSLRGL